MGYKPDTVNLAIAQAYSWDAHFKSEKLQNENESILSYENGIKYVDLAMKINPNYFYAYEMKFKLLHNLNKYQESLLVINDLLKLYPDSVNVIMARGVERWSLGDKKGAFDDIDFAINSKKLDSIDLSETHKFRSSFLVEMSEYKKALIDIDKAINYDTKTASYYCDRGSLYEKLGFKENACKDYRKAAELGFMKAYDDIKRLCQ